MRVYVGVTWEDLARAVADGGFHAPELAGCAVTPALREWYVGGNAEELEYAAAEEAARDSIARLADDLQARPRRVVIAAEVPPERVRPDPTRGRAAVLITGDPVSVAGDEIVSAHIDDAEAETAVRNAARAYPEAVAGDDDAAFTVDEAFGHELLWFARQELTRLLTES